MSVTEWKKEESVAIITMTNGENRHNPGFVHSMLHALDEIEQDDSLTSVVLTSNDPKNWSQGIDVNWVMSQYEKNDVNAVRQFMYSIDKLFMRILQYPMPVIAAINGHAFGNGAVMACTCDFRLMRTDKGFFCFPEIDINIPYLPSMVHIIKRAFPYYKFEEATYLGKRYGAPELEAHHVIVKASKDNETLQEDAIAYGKLFQKKRPIFKEMKMRIHKHIFEAMEKEDPAFIEPVALMVT